MDPSDNIRRPDRLKEQNSSRPISKFITLAISVTFTLDGIYD